MTANWPLWGAGLFVLGAFIVSRKATAYVAGRPVPIDLGPIGGGLYLRADAAAAYRAMSAAAAEDGVTLKPSGPRSAFRTMEMQASLDAELPALANPPGYSKHQEGIAVDIETAGGTNAAHAWLRANASGYRFVQPYPAREPWHWEFTG